MNNRISDWRAAIDIVDRHLLQLLNTRAKLACELARVKLDAGLGLLDRERERKVLSQACEHNSGPLDQEAVTRIFQSIIEEARRVQTQAQTRGL